MDVAVGLGVGVSVGLGVGVAVGLGVGVGVGLGVDVFGWFRRRPLGWCLVGTGFLVTVRAV